MRHFSAASITLSIVERKALKCLATNDRQRAEVPYYKLSRTISMKTLIRSFLLLLVSFILAAPLLAADENKAEKKPAKGKKAPAAALFNLPKTIQLTGEQQAKVKELIEKFNPRMAEIAAKQKEIITPEQAKARQEAMKKAREEGKKGKDLREAVEAAAQISGEQKQQLAEINKARQALQQEARAALMTLLTDEQKALLPKKGQKKPKDAA